MSKNRSTPKVVMQLGKDEHRILIVGTPQSAKLIRDSVDVPADISAEELAVTIEDMVVSNFPTRVSLERLDAHKRRMEASYGTG